MLVVCTECETELTSDLRVEKSDRKLRLSKNVAKVTCKSTANETAGWVVTNNSADTVRQPVSMAGLFGYVEKDFILITQFNYHKNEMVQM